MSGIYINVSQRCYFTCIHTFFLSSKCHKVTSIENMALEKTCVIRYRDCGTMGVTHSVYRFPTFIQRWMKLSFCLLNVSVLETLWNHRS